MRGECGMPTGDAYSSGHLVPSLWDLHMFYLLRPIIFRTCRYFSGLCSPNIPRYILDFALCSLTIDNGSTNRPVFYYTKPRPHYWTRPFTELWRGSIEQLRWVWHATPDTWSRPIGDFHMFYLLRQIIYRTCRYYFRFMLFDDASILSRFCL